MAYLLPKVEQAVQGGSQNQSNIFAPGQPQDTGGSAQPNSTIETNEDGGVIGSGAGDGVGSGGVSAAKPQQTAQKAKSSGAAMFKQGAQNMAQGLGSNIGQNIAGAQANQQAEANAYTATANATNYNPTEQEITSGIGGDQTSMTKIAGMLSGTQAPTADPMQFRTSTNTGASNLTSQAGVGNLLRARADDRYTAGESALDLALLGKDAGWGQQRQNILDQQNVLVSGQTAEVANALQKQANETMGLHWQGAQDSTRARLEAEGAKLTAQQKAEADAENLARQGIVEDKYTTRNAPVTADQAWDKNEAEQFNRITSMLGSGDTRLYGPGFGERSTYNKGLYDSDQQALADAKAAEQNMAPDAGDLNVPSGAYGHTPMRIQDRVAPGQREAAGKIQIQGSKDITKASKKAQKISQRPARRQKNT